MPQVVLSKMRTRWICLTILFVSAHVCYAGIVRLGKGSYTDTIPNSVSASKRPPTAKYVTENVSGPLPTTTWFSSLVCNAQSYTHYGYPLSFYVVNTSEYSGLQLGYPNVSAYADAITAPFKRDMEIRANVGGRDLKADSVKVDDFSDWTVTPYWQDSIDSTAFFRATYGHGLVFVYFEFSENCNPRITFINNIESVFDEQGALAAGSFSTDHIGVKFNDEYYGLFAPTGSTFIVTTNEISVTLPAGNRFFSVGLLTAQSDLSYYYQHAYAFVDDTNVSWNYSEATNEVMTTFSVEGTPKQDNQTVPILALLPHQWKSMSVTFLPQVYTTLLGTMKTIAASSFVVTQKFHGVLPYLPDKGTYDRMHLQELLSKDKTTSLSLRDSYFNGKQMAKVANLIPLAEQLGDVSTKEYLMNQLKNVLIDWFTYTTGETSRFFYYDDFWKGMIGYDNLFYGYNYTDHHFHNGYMIYAAALLSLYDPTFKTDYGEFVEYLIKDFANWKRDDSLFPFLRTFDPYMGHSYCAGTINIGSNGNNQESSSEAMNAWAAVVLWGMATNNTTIRDLGIWGYTTEYSGIYNYYFDIDDEVFPAGYQHKTAGILFDDKIEYTTWWTGEDEGIHGIQLIPETGSMLYLGYYPEYCRQNYDNFTVSNGGVENYDYWYNIFWKYQCFYDPQAALSKMNEYVRIDTDGDSFTSLYHWIHNFNALGSVDISVYADTPYYAVFKKGTSYTYTAYNSTATTKKVSFYNTSGYLGALYIRPNSIDAGNVFAPQITRIVASSHLNQGKSTVNIEGNGFLPGATATLRKTGETDIAAANVVVQGEGNISCEFDLTDVRLGNWELLAVNPGGTLETAQPTTFTVSGNAPVVTNSFPKKVSNKLKVSVSIVGYNFYPGVQVKLQKTGRQDIPGENVVLFSTERISCTFDVQEKSAGFWNVVVTNEDGELSALISGLELTEGSDFYVYPNPCLLSQTETVYFVNLPENSALSIYNVVGELVYGANDITVNPFVWPVKNSFEKTVASGIYIYVVQGTGKIWKGKIALIK